jgi:hypothetical protein
MCLRVGVRDHQADVMADQHDRALEPEMLAQQAMDVLRHRPLVVAARRPPRFAGAAIVEGDDEEARLRERRYHPPPLPPRLRKPVQEDDDARSGSGRHEVETQPRLDVGHAVRPDHGVVLDPLACQLVTSVSSESSRVPDCVGGAVAAPVPVSGAGRPAATAPAKIRKAAQGRIHRDRAAAPVGAEGGPDHRRGWGASERLSTNGLPEA